MHLKPLAGGLGLLLAAPAHASSPAPAPAPEASEPGTPAAKPWIRKHVGTPQLEIGAFGGLFFPSIRHDFYDPELTSRITRPPLWAMGGTLGVRVAAFPGQGVFGIEAELANHLTRARNPGDDFVYIAGARAHGILQLPHLRVTPFLLGGYGLLATVSPGSVLGRDVDPAGHWGAGLKLFLNQWLALRIEARHLLAAEAARQQQVTHHFEALAGLSVTLLHRKPKPKPPPDPDRDDDGFRNEVDGCPDTPGVEPDGCPPKDRDRDRFWDHQDECPDVPGVAPDGCPPPDTDGDGIIDPKDKCVDVPETKNGFEDQDGCPDEVPEEVKQFTGVIEGIEFELDKADIRAVSRPILDRAIQILREHPTIRLEISGHTDDTGTREHNVELSRQRAESVKRYFVEGGIDETRLQTRGAGPDEPLVPNDSDENRAKNRRTEFEIVTQ